MLGSPAFGRAPAGGAPDDVLRERELIARGLPLPSFDVRSDSLPSPRTAQLRAARALRHELGRRTTVKMGAFGGVSQIFRGAGFLTGAASDSPASVLRDFIARNDRLFRLSPSDLATFEPVAQDVDRSTGVTHLYLEQRIRGVLVFGSSLKAHVDESGRLISVEGDYVPGTSEPGTSRHTSAADALRAALRSSLPDILEKVSPTQHAARPSGAGDLRLGAPAVSFPTVAKPASRADQLTVFDPGPFAAPIPVRRVIFPTASGPVDAWQVEVSMPSRQISYVLVVSASTGRLLYRTNRTRSEVDSTARVFPKNPDDTPLSTRNFFGSPKLSPQGWSSGPATIGNNVVAPSATSNGNFSFPFTNAWAQTGANSFELSGLRLRYTPTNADATGYTVSAGPADSTAAAATNLVPFFSNTDDGTINLICGGGWTAKILGGTFTSFWVNTNGSVGFGAGSTDNFPTKVAFSREARRVAGLWRDLNPGGGGTLTGDCAPEGGGTRIRIVWNGVPNFPSGGSHTFAIVIHGIGTGLDNVIDVSYGPVTSATGELVGVGGNPGIASNPATSGVVSYRDLSASPAPGIPGGIAQTFPDQDLNLAVTNAAYQANVMHDRLYALGFDEPSGNYQISNFGKGGAPKDPIEFEAQFGLGVVNNSFLQPAPDGTQSLIATGLFSTDGGACKRDSAFDASIIRHEYTHGVSTRVVGGPANTNVLGSFQGGALGEGWSDGFAIVTLNDPAIGAYTTCTPRGVRSKRYDKNGSKYSDFANKSGPFTAGIGQVFRPEIHRDGEIWGTAAWKIYKALGQQVTIRLLFEALRYTPNEPTMVDARDAVLLADQVLYQGKHVKTLRNIFAARGLGVSAESSPGSFDAQPLLDGWGTTVFAAFDRPGNRYAKRTPVFFDNFDGATTAWTTAGADGAGGGALWHRSSRQASSGSQAFYYGTEATGNYNTGFRNYGSLMSPVIKLPQLGNSETLALEWDQRRITGDPFFFDGGWVRIIEVSSGNRKQVAFVENTQTSSGGSAFEHQKVSLKAFAGKKIKVEFFMDTFDSIANGAEGWYVDNPRISKLSPK